jgi:hypothetical protein
MNRQLFFRCVFSFEFIGIVASGLAAELMYWSNWYSVFYRHKGNFIDLLINTAMFITEIPVYTVLGALDSLIMRYTRKLTMTLIILSFFIFSSLAIRLGFYYKDYFSEQPLEWWLIDVAPKHIYLTGRLHVIVFLVKATWNYALGQPFSSIKAVYHVPGRHVAVERLSSSLMDYTVDKMGISHRWSNGSCMGSMAAHEFAAACTQSKDTDQASTNVPVASPLPSAQYESCDSKTSMTFVDVAVQTNLGEIVKQSQGFSL